MSDLFILMESNGLLWGFTLGCTAFFIGYAVNKGMHLFEL